MRKMQLWKVDYLTQDCKLVKEASRVWTQRAEPCLQHCPKLNLSSCGAWTHITTSVLDSQSISDKRSRWAVEAENCGCARQKHGREKHMVGLLFYTVESEGMTPEMSHWRCGNSGNADVLRKAGWTNAALWPLAVLESKECTTIMWR